MFFVELLIGVAVFLILAFIAWIYTKLEEKYGDSVIMLTLAMIGLCWLLGKTILEGI